jgi:hypothetical protein
VNFTFDEPDAPAALAFVLIRPLELRARPQHRDQLPPCQALLHLGETGPLSQGVQAGRKALRIRHVNGMKVRKKRPRGFKKRPRGFKRAP